MAHTIHSLDLKGKKIVNIENGKVIAEVSEILYDPGTHAIAALITSKAGIFKRNTEVVQQKDIHILGEDVVLANRADIIMDKKDLTGADQWMQISDQLKGISVITSEGTRVGRLNDLIVDEKGNVQALAVAAGQAGTGKVDEIPVSSLRSIGRDAIIIEPSMTVETEDFTQEQHELMPDEEYKGADTYETPEKTYDQTDLHREEHDI